MFFRTFKQLTLKLIVIRHFVDPLVRQPSSRIDSDVLSRSLNRLYTMGLELPKSTPAGRSLNWVFPYFEEPLIILTAFPKCDDIIDGKMRVPLNDCSLIV